MPAVRRNPLIEFLWSLHRWVYQASRGHLGSTVPGQLPVLLLTTTGRKTGLARTHPLGYLTVDRGYVVIGSNAGEPRHPAWYHNLRARPEAIVQVGPKRFRVTSREAEGTERERLWARVIERDGAYAEYQRRTPRRIPLMVLERLPQHA